MADNDLESSITGDVEELIKNKRAMSDDDFLILTYLDRGAQYADERGNPPVRGLLTPEGKQVAFHSGVRYLIKNRTDMLVAKQLPELDSGAREVVQQFFRWAFRKCLEEMQGKEGLEIVVSAGSHGHGWLGFGGDSHYMENQEDTFLGGTGEANDLGQYTWAYMTNKAMHDAIRNAMDAQVPPIPKLATLGFDACLMSVVEVMEIYHPIATSMVLSEAREPGHGWNYQVIDTNRKAREMGNGIVKAFSDGKHGRKTHSAPKTLGRWESSDFEEFKVHLDAMCIYLSAIFPHKSTILARARAAVENLEQGVMDQIDYGTWMLKFRLLCRSSVRLPAEENCGSRLQDLIEEAFQSYLTMTVTNGYYRRGPGTSEMATGISVWFPMVWGKAIGISQKHILRWFMGYNGHKAAKNRPFIDIMYKFLCSQPIIETIYELPRTTTKRPGANATTPSYKGSARRWDSERFAWVSKIDGAVR